MNGNTYQFPAVRGIQAGREYYVVMCPLKRVSRLFVFNDEEVPADMRAQRVLNQARVPDITRYLVTNHEDYVLSSITACIDGEAKFEPVTSKGDQRNLGTLHIDMDSRIIVNDGQHRRAAIIEAIKQCPKLSHESISVVLFMDGGLKRSQQWFADLNKHAVRPSRSIGILYDGREPMSRLCRDLIRDVPIFSNGLTELEKTSISNRSKKLFTLSAIHQATAALLSKSKNDSITLEDAQLAIHYWTYLGDVISEWKAVLSDEMKTSELREEYVHAHGVVLQAMGIVGKMVTQRSDNWKSDLRGIDKINWLRSNSIWQGNAIVHGKMSKSNESVTMTAVIIKLALGLPLNSDEITLQNRLAVYSGK
ncbi:MAG: DNA sulfur modification protein DndB [Chloroflexi bacterium]|nr:DNA sulfur modification protein DndB [Chloroflexota bacterium]